MSDLANADTWSGQAREVALEVEQVRGSLIG
jgi:hypothetical protein